MLPHEIEITDPIDKKCGTVEYLFDMYPYAKFGKNSFNGGFWECKKFHSFFPLSRHRTQARPLKTWTSYSLEVK